MQGIVVTVVMQHNVLFALLVTVEANRKNAPVARLFFFFFSFFSARSSALETTSSVVRNDVSEGTRGSCYPETTDNHPLIEVLGDLLSLQETSARRVRETIEEINMRRILFGDIRWP